MKTPHERLTRTTFSLPFGEVRALVGGAVNARILEVVPNLGHFLHVEAPATIAAHVDRWLNVALRVRRVRGTARAG